ncbi:MAG: hypothetical protein B7Z37_25750 [Verrucomicrobia bacterium 12-59-8]|nr:MAG: hypothetical protein B7Z37_25750 [Verrucomicrobia bacterium 12-59-8]
MKTKLLLLAASVLAVLSLSSCDVYATPYGGGYGYNRPTYRPSPSYYGSYNRGYSGYNRGYSHPSHSYGRSRSYSRGHSGHHHGYHH